MTTYVSKSLARKREMLENNEKGFTLIELLVVVLIIGVLAAIAIPIYLGTQDKAKENATISAVAEAKTAVIAQYTLDGTFPNSLTDVDGYTPGATLTVELDAGGDINGFCIEATYVGSGYTFHATEDLGPTAGVCL